MITSQTPVTLASGSLIGEGNEHVFDGWFVYNDDPSGRVDWYVLQDGSAPAVPAVQVSASHAGAKLYRRLPAPVQPPVEVHGVERVTAGRVLAGAGPGAGTAAAMSFAPAPDWTPFSFTTDSTVDQLVFCTDSAPTTFTVSHDVTVRSVDAVSADPSPPALGNLIIAPREAPADVPDASGMAHPASETAHLEASTSGPAPMVAFDPAGVASVISYQVPEPTSYTGKHVLVLEIPLSDFADVKNTGGTNAAVPNVTAAVAPPLSSFVAVPPDVVVSDSTQPSGKVVALSPFPPAARLRDLSWSDVAAAVAVGRRIEIFRSVGGNLDFRIVGATAAAPGSTPTPTPSRVPAPTAFASTVPLSPMLAAAPQLRAQNGGPGGGYNPHPYVYMRIQSPDPRNPLLTGPWQGVAVPVSGGVTFFRAGIVSVHVALIAADNSVKGSFDATVSESGDGWSGSFTITQSGTYTISATATSSQGNLKATAGVAVTVKLDPQPKNPPPPPPPAIAPSIVAVMPAPNTVLTAQDANPLVEVSGVVDSCGGVLPLAVRILVDDVTPGVTAATSPIPGTTRFTFTAKVLVSGEGMHTLTVTATSGDGTSAPAVGVPVKVARTAPYVVLDRKLMIIERIALSSFLGDYGASRLVKTFSLLPGEQTTISIDSYTKSTTTATTASSILDSTATECAADFEDTINSDNESKASTATARSTSISANVGAAWAWGHVDISGAHTDSANASRENMTKTVVGALAKHTSKASSNRTVSVNTDFTQSTETGQSQDTQRVLKNINVSRVLNFVFRQMTQRHHVLVHVVDATVGYYRRDQFVDAAGVPIQDGNNGVRETFVEYSLPELGDFVDTEMTGMSLTTLQQDILNVLSSIPDYKGTQQSLVELVTPTSSDGKPQPDSAYLRVKPELSQTYVSSSGAQFTVPGIILNTTDCVMRTDQLLCDALLGEGDALDSYSHSLQDVAIAERNAAVAAREAETAREKLAQQIIASNNANMAALWSKVYPVPLSVPATVTVRAHPDGTSP